MVSGIEDDPVEVGRLIAEGLELARKHGIRSWTSVLVRR